MNGGSFAGAKLCKLGPERLQRPRQSERTGARPGPAQDRPFQRGDRRKMGTGRRTEPRQRMLEEGEQLYRGEPLERRVGDEAREHAGHGLRERIAAGIVGDNVPAIERDQNPPRQRAVRRHQGGGALRHIERLTQGDRDGERLLLDVRRLDHGDGIDRPRQRAGRIGGGEALTPSIGRRGRA